MKKAFCSWYNYVIALVLTAIAAGIGFIPYFALNDASKWPKEYIFYVFLFAGCVILLVGFVIQDLYRARCRHKTKNWNNPLPEEVVEKAWKIMCPALLAGLTCVAAGIIATFIIQNIH